MMFVQRTTDVSCNHQCLKPIKLYYESNMDDTKDQDTTTRSNSFVREHPWTSRRNLMPAFNNAANEAIAQEIEADMMRKLDLSYGRLFIAKSLMQRTKTLMDSIHSHTSTSAAFRILSRDQGMLEDILWEAGRMAEKNELSPEALLKIKTHLAERIQSLDCIMRQDFTCAHYLWAHYAALDILKSKFFSV